MTSTEDQALNLLASFDWKSCGKQLVMNADLNPEAAENLIRNLGGIATEALDLRLLGGRIFVNAGQVEKLFKLEGLPLKVCRNGLVKRLTGSLG